jgi:hypothetical protein
MPHFQFLNKICNKKRKITIFGFNIIITYDNAKLKEFSIDAEFENKK